MATEKERAYQAAYRVVHREDNRAYQAAYRAAHREENHNYAAAYRAANREELRLKDVARYLVRRETMLADKAAHYEAHKDEKRVYNAAYAAAHREGISARKNAWKKANPGKHSASHAKRRAAKRQAYPPGTDQAAVAKIYQQCAWLSMASGVEHEVDHGVPLIHSLVCGLHVPFNLRIITASENAAKGNRFHG